MGIKGNPKICPKPCPSVSFCLKPVKIEETVSKDSFVETKTESFQNENRVGAPKPKCSEFQNGPL